MKTKAQWSIPAKLLNGRGGAQGVLLVTSDAVVFQTDARGKSRTWRISDIDNVSTSNPLELAVTAAERDFRFELKQELADKQFNEIWRRINAAKGLQVLSSTNSTRERQWRNYLSYFCFQAR